MRLLVASLCLVATSAAKDTSEYGSLSIKKDKAGISLGKDGDVMLYRSGDGNLTVMADSAIFTGGVDATGDLFIREGSVNVGDSLDSIVSTLDDMEGGAAIGSWKMLWSLDMPDNGNFDTVADVPYRVNNMPTVPDGSFSKVAYYLQLDDKWVLTTMDAFTDDTTHVGIPVDWDHEGDTVTNLAVYSNEDRLADFNGQRGMTGIIEHWSNCYGTGDGSYNSEDTISTSEDCYGSLQVHSADGDTIFAYNAWSSTGADDVGMGNNPSTVDGQHPDWTFARNVNNYEVARLTALVYQDNAPLPAIMDTLAAQDRDDILATMKQARGFPEGWNVAFSLDLENNANYDDRDDISYIIDNSGNIPAGSFNKVGYHFQLDDEWVWVQMDAFTDNATYLGIPVDWDHDGDDIQNMAVYSNVGRLSAYDGQRGLNGTIEHWSNCYGTGDDSYNSEDTISTSEDCYGSLQVHSGDGDTIFAYNAWSSTGADDVGMGNNPSTADGQHPDWTFARNAGTYDFKRLTIAVYQPEPGIVAATFPTNVAQTNVPSSSAGGEISRLVDQVEEKRKTKLFYENQLGWKLVYQLALVDNADYDSDGDVPYSVNLAASIPSGSFNRIAYHLQLDDDYVYVEMDPFTTDASLLGIPVDWDHDGDAISNMRIRTNNDNLEDYDGVSGLSGNIEHWSNCYGTGDGTYDGDDVISASDDCYGSFQVHAANGDTIFAYNAWSSTGADDVGMGNNPSTADGQHQDWTFARNAANYDIRQLSVFVYQVPNEDQVPPMVHNSVATGLAEMISR